MEYEELKLEIILFEASDVITGSDPDTGDFGGDVL